MLPDIENISREYLCQKSWYDNGSIGYPFCSEHSLSRRDWGNYARGIMNNNHDPSFIVDSPVSLSDMDSWKYIKARIIRNKDDLFYMLRYYYSLDRKEKFVLRLALSRCECDDDVWHLIKHDTNYIQYLNFEDIRGRYAISKTTLLKRIYHVKLYDKFIEQIRSCVKPPDRQVTFKIEEIMNDIIDLLDEEESLVTLLYKAIKYIRKYGNNNILERLITKLTSIGEKWSKNV